MKRLGKNIKKPINLFLGGIDIILHASFKKEIEKLKFRLKGANIIYCKIFA